ncbi:Subtilase family protein [Abeliophyllum distichum]|uniref:Subtilase family protein n=1 Tax=Abeliophyllum distichum TaxID=126358 RepID=A0ABD1P880_9LAMI
MSFPWAYCIIFFVVYQHFCFTAAISSNVYIVYMGEKPYDAPELAENSHHELLSDILGGKKAAMEAILYSYTRGFSGFSAVLTPSQARIVAGLPGVVRVVPNRIFNLHTTRSWDFLQFNPQLSNGILLKGQSGAGSIIGVLDSGIWPESESFKDDGMEDVPSRWKGICQEGEEFNHSNCNRKIIGARWYIKGYEAEFGKLITSDGTEFLSPRDATGHGTHTSSTVAGAWIENANVLGLGQGLARGGAPSAWLAVYKVCWATGGCSSADILAAFDDAIFDGVDVISMSLGSLPPLSTYVDDTVSIGSFHAMAKGISVVCSGGNNGPYSETVVNTAPWVITVAASTIDRAFPIIITLGNNQTFVGQALYMSEDLDKFYPIVYGEDIMSTDAYEDDARSCIADSLNATLARGKVLLCFESRLQRFPVNAARTVKNIQGIGLVFAKFRTKEVSLCLDVPCAQVDLTIGTSLLTYIGSTSNPVVKFNLPKTAVGRQISPNVALFSSRGPSSLSPNVLKPDIAAPGVDILAAWSAATRAQPSGAVENHLNPFKFKFASGTSMACPHISAIVSLLKVIHPTWSPAAIKSALVTTASLTDEYGQAAVAEGAPHKQADPFDYGGGHVDPNKAVNPGLVYDLDVKDHARFLCAMGYNATAISLLTRTNAPCRGTANFLANFNLPSITIPQLKNCMTVSRTVTNVGPDISIYTAMIQSPPGTDVVVKPPILTFSSDVKKLKFKVTFCSLLRVQGTYSFGNLLWDDGSHVVRIPLIVRSIVEEYYH